MNAKVIFINENEIKSTNSNYALASGIYCEQRNSAYISVNDLVDFIQTSQNATAEEIIKAQEENVEGAGNTIAFHQEWRTYNWILSELKRYQTK